MNFLLPALMLLAVPAHAATVEATLDLGDFENSTQQIENGQNLEQAPFNFYYSHSGTQVIYTAEEVSALYEHGASITSISFRYGDTTWSSWYDFSHSLTCYMELIDDSEFKATDGKYKWISPAGEPVSATATLEYTMDLTGDYFDITLTFDTPFVIKKADAGKSLLITSTSDLTEGESDYGQYVRPCVYSNEQRNYRMACYGNDKGDEDFLALVKSGAEIGGTRSDVYKYDLPVARIKYSYNDTPTAIDDIAAESTGKCRVYNMSGMQIGDSADNLPKGIYIIQSGSETKKMVVK